MTDTERREALLAALEAWPGSDRALAEAAGFSHTTLGRIRSGDLPVSQTAAAAVAAAMYSHAADLKAAADKLTEDLERTAVAAEDLPSGQDRFRQVAKKLAADQERFRAAVLATSVPFEQMMVKWKAQSEQLQKAIDDMVRPPAMPQLESLNRLAEGMRADAERIQDAFKRGLSSYGEGSHAEAAPDSHDSAD